MRPNDERSAELMRALVAGRQVALNELMTLWEGPLLRFIPHKDTPELAPG